jgi:hypothetical protein
LLCLEIEYVPKVPGFAANGKARMIAVMKYVQSDLILLNPNQIQFSHLYLF